MSESERDGDRHLARRMAGSAITLIGRRAVIQVMTAVGTAIVARLLGGSEFGELASALAIYVLLLAASDFGFGFVLGRDLATDVDGRGRLVRAAAQVQIAWAGVLALVAVGMAFASGVGTTRGGVLLVLAPAVVLSGLGSGRQVFLVLYRVRTLAFIDIATNLAQVLAMVLVVWAGAGAVAAAATVTIGAAANVGLVFAGALRLVDDARPEQRDRSELIRACLPLGVVSFMASVYLSIDLAILGWLASGPALGDYAVAVKVLSLLVTIPGLVMGAALPGLSVTASDDARASAMAARVWHWMMAIGVPACVGAAVFAHAIVVGVFGDAYGGAVPLVRILCLAGVIALLSNVLGTALVARRRIRPLIVQNGIAIAVNLGGNVLLVPRYGVAAAAWLTVATEAIVCAGSLLALRGSMRLGPLRDVSTRPALATAAMAAVALPLLDWWYLAIPGGAAAFVAGMLLLRAWPHELTPAAVARYAPRPASVRAEDHRVLEGAPRG